MRLHLRLKKKEKKLLVWRNEGLDNRVGRADFLKLFIFLNVCTVFTVVNSVRITLRPSKAMAVDALRLGLDALYFYGIL